MEVIKFILTKNLSLTTNYTHKFLDDLDMKKIIWSTIGMVVFTLFTSGAVFAQGMMGNTITSSDGHTAREEAEGKIVWEKLQAKQVQCSDLSDDDFGVLGEYFMGQMTGTSHEAMNTMMEQMMGKEGEEQMHVVMGKRLSGCDTSAAIPSQGTSFMSMMNFGFTPFGGFGWIFMILWWVLIIAGIVALIKWLMSQSRGTQDHEKSSLEILKERYAKGEIDKKEFEDKKKDLT